MVGILETRSSILYEELLLSFIRHLPMSRPYHQAPAGPANFQAAGRYPDQSSQLTIYRLPRRQKRAHPSYLTLITLSVIGLVILFLMVLAAGVFVYGYYQFGNRIFPGIKVGQLALSGMTQREAAVMLDKTWNLDASLLVTNGIQNQQIPPSQIGIVLDSESTSLRASEVGRQGSIPAQLAQIYSVMKDGWQVEPIVTIDPQTALLGLQGLSASMSKPPKNATIQIQGADLVAVPPELGYTINIEESLNILEQDPGNTLKSGILRVALKPVAPEITDATGVLQEARKLLDQSAVIQVYDPVSDEQKSYPIPRETLASWLRVNEGELGPDIGIDEAGVASFLKELSEQIGEGRSIDAQRFAKPLAQAISQGKTFWVTASHPATSYIVQSGDTLLKIGWRMGIPTWMILRANNNLDPDKLITGTTLVIPSKDDLLPLPIIANKRILISLSRQRLTIFQDGQQIGQHVISTGIDRSPTQPGIFQVQTHDPNAYASVWDLYMPNFLGIYEAWPGFMNGIHGLPLLSSGQRMWANSLGRPASYGCIILGLQEAKWLYDWAEDGVIVEIQE
jgi:LysM repeat protein